MTFFSDGYVENRTESNPIEQGTNVAKFLSKVEVAPYSVLGTRLSREGKFETITGKPEGSEALVDPAGLPYVSGQSPMKEAGAASGVIYRWLGVNDFPQDVRDGIKRATDAKFHKYDENKSYVFPRIRTENSELKHTKTNRVVHVVGPDFRQESKDNRSGLETLARAYTNILSETARSQVSSLRLLPVSGGVFAAHFRNDIHFMTWHALVQGFKNLSKEEQESILKMDSLKMCIFMEKELDDFERAREWITLSHGSSSKL